MAKITDIKYQKNKDRVNIYLDGKFYAGLSAETLFKNNLKVGDFVSENSIAKIQAESETSTAFEKALRLIERKLYFERELRTKLKEKGYLPDTIDIVIAKLKDYNYINDDKLTKSFIESQGARSKKEIEYKLKQKGVSDFYIQKNSELITPEIEKQNCFKLAEKYAKHKDKTVENMQKTLKYLVSKGFSFETSKSAVKNIFKDIEEDYD